MSNDLVAYSRAGDVFHYRWAARRCLGLVYPNGLIESIVIEGSKENEKQGEYVVDVAEYYDEIINKKQIKYYQLKHTTVQKDSPFVLSDLKDTIEGFSKRYGQHLIENNPPDFSFTIVTNRPIEDSFKQNIILLANNETVNKRFTNTIEKYTGFSSDELSKFCKLLNFDDGEGDYNTQKDELRLEIAQLIAGAVDNAQIESIVALVQERVLPDSNGIISRQDILKRFGISSERDLFPAPVIWEQANNIINREQHEELIKNILSASYPVIVYAPGGVGKSVFCRQLIHRLPSDSIGIAYDCFGAGRYRNRSEPRHRHRDALVQIINEIAVKGLCDPLLVQDTSNDNDIMKKFLWRIETVVKTLKQTNNSANLFILIDAADNAEMAAQEYNHPCFANELLRENIPEGCKLVLLCRTERIELLKPSSKIVQFELKEFSETESLINLQKWFSEADENDGTEFHRLTSGNPRVQANALSVKASSVSELLSRLGPAGMTVEEQIELQLNTAISAIKDSLSDSFQEQIQAICLGLASLPPHIPIEILAKAARVTTDTIKSFVADIGRSLWLSDESVQFRDEPTETWFRKTFLAKKEIFENYINILEPLAKDYTYVAEVLPHLYLQAEKYENLIEIALSDNYLPEDNPIDARNVRVYRLQFAFRAALRAKQYNDAIKIAMRAGEEVAGNQRQLGLFLNNIDLLVNLQDKQKVQDIAFKRLLSGAWNGSENVYTASLLSGINEYKGEARGYLRAAVNWLKIHFEELKKSDERHPQNEVTEGNVVELAYAFFNIYGVEDCINFLNRFTSKAFVFGIIKNLIKRLVDVGNFEAINDFLKTCTRQQYYTVAIVSELMKIGIFPEKHLIDTCLMLLTGSKSRIKRPQHSYHNDNIIPAIVSFTEACLHRNLPSRQILRVLRHYIPSKASRMVYSEHQSEERTVYLKTLAIRKLLEDKSEVDIDAILPENLAEKKKKNDNDRNNEIKEFKEVINGLFPWYFLRVRILSQQDFNFADELKNANDKSINARTNRYRSYDTLPNEIAALQSSILILHNKGNTEEINWFYNTYFKNNKSLWISDEHNIVRAAFRLSHLSLIKQELELSAYERIKSTTEDGPEETAERYIGLARAVLNTAPDDASVYFEEAVNIVSKFGDEIVRRWEAVVSLAKQSCNGDSTSDELAYRFIRCAEVVGEYVSREKYWNRSEAIAICARISSGEGISALSRWRDRDIGRFEYQLEALLIELIQSSKISSSTGWAMSRFFSYHQHEELLSLCLENETNIGIKKKILADAIHLLQIEGSTPEYWKKMELIASRQNIQNEALDGILVYNQKNKKTLPEYKKNKTVSNTNHTEDYVNWEHIFGTLNILNNEQFEKCIHKFNTISKKSSYRNINNFWNEAIIRLSENNLWKFIEVLLSSELSHYEFTSFFNSLPEEWKNKVSFKKKWTVVVKQLGFKYAQELVSPYSFRYFVEHFSLNKDEINKLKEGIFEGLANGYEFSDAEMFFGFVSITIPTIDSLKAADLLDYTLSRFELHIDNDFGDGEWRKELFTDKNINNQIAGFIWSALGSPRSVDRWNAVHTVRVLAEFNCTDIIDELINWLKYNKVGAYGNHKFPFYNLHARLYSLIALVRISLEKPELLTRYNDIFIQYAFGEPHALIQKFSAEIAVNISISLENIYNEETLRKLKSVGKNKMPILEMNYNEKVDSYWHINTEIATEYDFHFGWDFDRYWFEPLGNVFGIPGKQVEDIAANVIIKEWGIKDKNGYYNDPRVSIWNRDPNERETSHSHGSYPKTDNLDFYLSYHSMMVAAAKLIEKMPIVSKRDWYDNEWDEWISGHLLTCDDGKWLIDYSDPVPLKRPEWISKNKDGNWRTDISENNYIEALLTDNSNGEKWFCVKGGWEEGDGERTESFSITSSLVSKNTSKSLMIALETCSDPYDYKLPDYEEDDNEIDSDSFILKGWIKDESISKRLDKYDPYADNVDYPPYIVGADIMSRLNLSLGNDGKFWYLPTLSFPALQCEIWSSHRSDRDENPDQAGKQLKASLQFLKHMCSTLNCDMIFEVSIKREINYKYRSQKDKYEYSKPIHKLFILSSDGELRTTGKNHKLG
ncbi:P-loop domain-containing protein [Flavobacterium flavipallidum]|uniref:Nephrocystin 3-like N-terminal domain-containing protein n=1 Tax=Flavobacterium flavipallidum TaxID=3139140 RepID=A0ABU9HJU0_9FLAO